MYSDSQRSGWISVPASYAALGTIFLGALSFLVYQAGQLATVTSAALYLNALPYFFEWSEEGSGAAFPGVSVRVGRGHRSPRRF